MLMLPTLNTSSCRSLLLGSAAGVAKTTETLSGAGGSTQAAQRRMQSWFQSVGGRVVFRYGSHAAHTVTVHSKNSSG